MIPIAFLSATPLPFKRLIIPSSTAPLHPPTATLKNPSSPSSTAQSSLLQWNPKTWRSHPILQQPVYPDNETLHKVETRLSQNPPLVFPGELARLRAYLSRAATGDAFVLQAGDCAESFDHFRAQSVAETFRVLVAQTLAISYISGLPVLKIGRVAGQFAKPRSSPTERVEDMDIPVYRGDIVNSVVPDGNMRVPDPQRLLRAYSQSAASLNMLRALAKSTDSMMEWVELIGRLAPARYSHFVEQIDDALNFLKACGLDVMSSVEGLQNMREPEFYSSHEALLLPYEAALTREYVNRDGRSGWYCSSAHMLWVGERTRQLDGAHVEFLRGIDNPVGIKVGPTVEPEEVLRLLDALNPNNEEGKIMLIVRMGCDKLPEALPPLLRVVKQEGRNVVWSIDPMHGNTIQVNGIKTRPLDRILKEIDGFFEAHRAEGTVPGGVHLEMTGEESVTECLGGEINEITEDILRDNYKSMCDPRLNGLQSMEVAFEVGERLRALVKSGSQTI